ncbi:MAG: hypothetical protein IH592_11945, partial [Bacteroidales bacterium]|nr:hypothetical protein [Bacteroidales bacterium]
TNGDSEGRRPGSRGLSVHILPDLLPGDPLPEGSHMMGHTGSAYGLNSAFFFDPKDKYGFVFMMNGSFDGPARDASSFCFKFEEALLKALTENSAMPCK